MRSPLHSMSFTQPGGAAGDGAGAGAGDGANAGTGGAGAGSWASAVIVMNTAATMRDAVMGAP